MTITDTNTGPTSSPVSNPEALPRWASPDVRLPDGSLASDIIHMARTAIDVQDACNLSGVLHTWSVFVSALRAYADKLHRGTSWLNHHPINQLFASKVHDLSSMGLSETLRFGFAYDWCANLRDSKSPSNVDLAEYIAKDLQA